jgi:hypothetical protein
VVLRGCRLRACSQWLLRDQRREQYKLKRRMWVLRTRYLIDEQHGDSRRWLREEVARRRAGRAERAARRLVARGAGSGDVDGAKTARAIELRACRVDRYVLWLETKTHSLAAQAAKVELALMTSTDEVRVARKELAVVTENLAQVQLHTAVVRQRVDAAQRAVAVAGSTLRSVQLQLQAEQQQHDAVVRLQSAAKLHMLNTRAECERHDVEVHAGIVQRVETALFMPEIHSHYFRTLATQLVLRAEAVALERRMWTMLQREQDMALELAAKQSRFLRVQTGFVRKLRLRQARSEMPLMRRARRQQLSVSLLKWREFTKWKAHVREVYEASYAIEKTRRDVEQLKENKRRDADAAPPEPSLMIKFSRGVVGVRPPADDGDHVL